MGVYYYRHLLERYQIVRRLSTEDGRVMYYVQEQRGDGGWVDVRGPFRQTGSASAWLDRKRLRELMAAKKRGDTIIYPPGHPSHED